MIVTEKSRGVSFSLTLLSGPIGLLYATIPGGLILIVVALVTAPTIIGPVVCSTGDYAVQQHNAAIRQLVATLNRR